MRGYKKPNKIEDKRPVLDKLVLCAETESDRRALGKFYLELRKTGKATLSIQKKKAGYQYDKMSRPV